MQAGHAARRLSSALSRFRLKTIEIIVTADGSTSVQTLGFSGASCQQASRFIEEALGKRTGEKLTAEFRQGQSVQHTNQQHIG